VRIRWPPNLYFGGININGDKTISRREFAAFVIAALAKDQNYALNLVFYGFGKLVSR
jgi:hypothetical protein